MALNELGARAVGIDLSWQQLDHARKAASQGTVARLVQGDAEMLPFGDEVFDIVFCDHGAIVFAPPDKVVTEATRVLKPNGLLALCMPSPIRDICYNSDGGTVTSQLTGNYFNLSAFDDGESVEYQLPYGTWIRLFRSNRLHVEDLVELQPPPDATTTYEDFAGVMGAAVAGRAYLEAPEGRLWQELPRSRHAHVAISSYWLGMLEVTRAIVACTGHAWTAEMKSSSSFRDLKVWHQAMSLVEDIYRLSTRFPETERFGLTAQLRRAAVSIPSNIGEGKRRKRHRAFLYHLDVALGSQGELEVQLEIAQQLGFAAAKEFEPVMNRVAEVGRMLNGLIEALQLDNPNLP